MKRLARHVCDLTLGELVTLRWRRKPTAAAEVPVEYAPIDVIMKALHEAPPMPAAAMALLTKAAESPEELRRQKELEAGYSGQPFEWSSHVYVTVHGELRWRCCAHLFTETHSPWCAMPQERA